LWSCGSPTPVAPDDRNQDFWTYYVYDVLNHLTQVWMPRPTGTQTRTFVYNAQQRLQSATNPENGTVNYGYNADGTLQWKTDSKNQRVEYSYNARAQVTQVRRYPVSGGAEDVCQRADFSYDSNPYDGTFSQNASGRLTAVRWGGGSCATDQFTEMYSYTQAGLVTKKRLRVYRAVSPSFQQDLDGTYTYDNEGKTTSVSYPTTYQFHCYPTGWVAVPGPVYTYSFDSLGRPNKLTDNSAVDWVKDVVYGAAGQVTQMRYWNGGSYYLETKQYNARLQMTRLTTVQEGYPGGTPLDMEYRYSATQNDGRITQSKDWVSGEEVTYQYDTLQR